MATDTRPWSIGRLAGCASRSAADTRAGRRQTPFGQTIPAGNAWLQKNRWRHAVLRVTLAPRSRTCGARRFRPSRRRRPDKIRPGISCGFVAAVRAPNERPWHNVPTDCLGTIARGQEARCAVIPPQGPLVVPTCHRRSRGGILRPPDRPDLRTRAWSDRRRIQGRERAARPSGPAFIAPMADAKDFHAVFCRHKAYPPSRRKGAASKTQ